MAKQSGGEFLPEDQVIEVWGEQFKELAVHPKVRFTESEVFIGLSKPIPAVDSGGGTTDQIVLLEPNVGQLKMMDSAKGDVAKAAALIQSCSDLPAASVNKIKGRDFMLLNKVVAAFLSDGHQTGQT